MGCTPVVGAEGTAARLRKVIYKKHGNCQHSTLYFSSKLLKYDYNNIFIFREIIVKKQGC